VRVHIRTGWLSGIALAVMSCAMGGTGPALAQEAAPGDATAATTEAPDVVIVSATRVPLPETAIPTTVQVITPEQARIQTQIGGSAIDAVSALVPSFTPTRQKMTGAGETLRGRSPLFMIDGVPQSTPLRDGSRDGFTIDPFMLDRVEVIFGSNAIQGVGAAGGVINYVTARPARGAGGLSGAFQVQSSSDGGFSADGQGWRGAVRVGGTLGALDLVVGLAGETRGTFFDGDGRRVGVDGTQGELQDSQSWSVFLKTGMDFGKDRRLELMVNHFELAGNGDLVVVAGNRLTGLPTSAVPGTQLGVVPVNYATTASLTWRDRAVFGGTFTAQAYATDFESVFGGGIFPDFQDPALGTNFFDQSSNNSDKQGFKFDWSGPVAVVPGLRLTAGLDGLRDVTFQQLIATGRNWVPETTFTSVAPFLQLNQALFDGRLNLAAGIRREDATLKVGDYETLWFNGRLLSPPGRIQVAGGEPEFAGTLVNYGATFEVVDGFQLYGSYAQGFTMADVGRILRDVRTRGQDVDQFLALEPVVSDNVELGIELNTRAIRASLAWFGSTSDQGAILVLTDGDIFRVQRQRTEIDGFDLSLRYQTPIEGLSLSLAGSAMLGKSDTNNDGVVETDLSGPNIAPDRLLLAADWQSGPWTARVQHQSYAARDFTGIGVDSRNNFDGYELVDLYVCRSFGFGDVALSVTNAFDTQYISYNSDTERPTDNLRYFAGRGRVVSLSWERRF
jgi:iron complex outermembrane recepter protein